MLHQTKIIFLLAFALGASLFSAQETLSTEKLNALKAKPCSYVHVWALWCDICVEELPKLVDYLNKTKKVNPLLIDVTPETGKVKAAQEMEKAHPRFPVYAKPYGNDEQYMKAIDANWGGGLPYSALYQGGKVVKVWSGASSLSELAKATDALCK